MFLNWNVCPECRRQFSAGNLLVIESAVNAFILTLRPSSSGRESWACFHEKSKESHKKSQEFTRSLRISEGLCIYLQKYNVDIKYTQPVIPLVHKTTWELDHLIITRQEIKQIGFAEPSTELYFSPCIKPLNHHHIC